MFNLLKRQDWFLNLAIGILAVAGLAILYSISGNFFWRQAIWFFTAAFIIFSFSLINWRSLMDYRWLILAVYFFSILLLVITLIFAPTIRSSKSWLVIGQLRFQTSEFAKIALIFILAYFFARRHFGIAYWGNILKSFIYFIIPTALVLIQPDLGSAMVFLGIWIGFLLVSGIPWRYILIGLIILILFISLIWAQIDYCLKETNKSSKICSSFLKDYQRERIIALFNPAHDPLGVNYSVTQSKIAIGSGGFLGKGFQQGTQVQLGFLPEAQSDFIFAAFVEEWGLLGGIAVIGAFVFLILRLIKIGLAVENNFGRLICLGTIIMFLIQFALNIGSNLGLFPVIGISFPFLSYGGSNLLINAILIGIIQSLAVRSTFLRA